MAHIKAIPTAYNGTEFRSRLEARWAMFLHVAGYKYEYEPCGSGTMPDFFVHGIGTLEIKPAPVVDSYLKHMRNRNVRYLAIGGFYRGRKPVLIEVLPDGVKRFLFDNLFQGLNPAFQVAANHRFDLA